MAKSLLERTWELWGWQGPLSRRVSSVLALGLVLYCAATAYLGALHTTIFGVDYFIFLDSGWRVLTGQRPHIDFHTTQGPIFALYSALAMRLGGGSIDLGFGLVRALVTGAFSSWCFLLLRKRIPPAGAIVASVMVTLLAGAPFALTSAPFAESMSMFYNRYGYVLLGLVIFEGFLPAEGYRGGLSTGMAAGLLLFFKISFFGASMGFIALSLLVRGLEVRRLMGMIAGLVAVSGAFLIWLRFDIGPILYDLRALAEARSSGFPIQRFLRIMNESFLGAVFTLTLGLVVSALLWDTRAAVFKKLESIALALLAIGVEPAVAVSNQQDSVLLVMSVCCLILLSRLSAVKTVGSQGRSALGAVVLLGLCVPLPGTTMDLIGFGSAVRHALVHRGAPDVPRLDTPEYAPLIFEGELPGVYRYESGAALVRVVNEGCRLLRANTGASDRVLTLGFVNPFPALLRRPAPRGSAIWMVLNYNVSFPDNFPSAESMFAEVDAIMVPTYLNLTTSTTDALVTKYKPIMERDFNLKMTSASWLLYTRRRPQ